MTIAQWQWQQYDVVYSMLAQLAELFISAGKNAVCVYVCLDVNQGGTYRNHCTHTLVILHAQTLITCQKPGQFDVLYESKSPPKKWAWVGIFQPAEPHSPWDACFIVCIGMLESQSPTSHVPCDGVYDAKRHCHRHWNPINPRMISRKLLHTSAKEVV